MNREPRRITPQADPKSEDIIRKVAEFDWIDQLETIIDFSADPRGNRNLLWFSDSGGNSGKTLCCKYLQIKYTNQVMRQERISDSNSTMYTLGKALEEREWTGRIFLLDIPRAEFSASSSSEMYSALESLLNGEVKSTKYKGLQYDIGGCWVVVFANYGPNYEMMSADRIIHYDISDRSRNLNLAERRVKTVPKKRKSGKGR